MEKFSFFPPFFFRNISIVRILFTSMKIKWNKKIVSLVSYFYHRDFWAIFIFMYKNRGEIETEEGKSKKKKIEKRIKQCILVTKKKKKKEEKETWMKLLAFEILLASFPNGISA